MSAFVSDYTFNNLSRIGEDGCSLGQRGIQNVEASNYMLQNFFSDDCTMKRPIEFATSQPSISALQGRCQEGPRMLGRKCNGSAISTPKKIGRRTANNPAAAAPASSHSQPRCRSRCQDT